MAYNPSSEVLSSVAKHKKAELCLMGEEKSMIDKLHSGMCCNNVGSELNVNE